MKVVYHKMRKQVSMSGDGVLKLLLDGSGLTFSKLSKALGFASDSHTRYPMELLNLLWELNDAGLISVDGVEQDPKQIHAALLRGANARIYSDKTERERRIRASDAWRKIQAALGVRHFVGHNLTGRKDACSVIAYPIFGMPTALPKQSDVFVLMPFSEDLAPIYSDHICRAVAKLDLSVMRADDLFTHNSVMADVWSGIVGAGVVIADCTNRNPNVFYEIGIAHTLGKPTILITQRGEDVPVDLRHIKYIVYDYTPGGMQKFENSLVATLTSAFMY